METVLSDYYPNFLYDYENLYCKVLRSGNTYIFEFKAKKTLRMPAGLEADPREFAEVKAARAFFVKKAVDEALAARAAAGPPPPRPVDEALAARAAAGPPPPRPGDCDDPTTEQIIYEELN